MSYYHCHNVQPVCHYCSPLASRNHIAIGVPERKPYRQSVHERIETNITYYYNDENGDGGGYEPHHITMMVMRKTNTLCCLAVCLLFVDRAQVQRCARARGRN